MGSDSGDSDASMEIDVNNLHANNHWGKSKRDYYYTDYIDKDYPSKLTAKEERAARIEQEEALRIQKKLLSTLDNLNIEQTFDDQDTDLIDFLENQNKSIESEFVNKVTNNKKNQKKVKFNTNKHYSDEEFDDEDFVDEDGDDEEGDDGEDDDDDDVGDEDEVDIEEKKRIEALERRRPINIAMKRNRGLTPYKKKEYRNPRVKHKNKYRKAISKRKRNVKEARIEYHRYSGEANGIKTSTIKSLKLN